MSKIYQSKINAEDVDFDDPADLKALQASLDELGLDHFKHKDGRVFRILGKLNKKSVPVNSGTPSDPQRVNFTSVVSFGLMEDKDAPTEYAKAVTDGDTGKAEQIAAENRAQADELKARFKGTDAETIMDDPDANPIAPSEMPSDPEIVAKVHAAMGGAPAHADRDHALLSASGAHRWLNCTPSPLLEAQHPDSESAAAAEGTEAHEMAEYFLRTKQGEDITAPKRGRFYCEEMVEHAQAYATFVTDKLSESSAGAFLAVEQRLNFSHIVPDGFGTGDAMIVDDGTLTIIDLKYGKGVEVSAVGNPQMQLYALGALHQFGMIYDIQQVRMIIFQPRLNNISVAEKSVSELNEWAETVVKPAAKLATNGEGELTAGSWCQFCRHAPQCEAVAKQHFAVVPQAEKIVPLAPEPGTLTDDQIAQIVLHAGELKKWLTAVEKFALDKANTGHAYNGLKLVEGRSVRKYADEQAVADAVQEAGYNPYEKKLHGITNMKKLLGAKQFRELVEPHLHKPDGKPTLVPEADKRPALTVASADNVFNAIT